MTSRGGEDAGSRSVGVEVDVVRRGKCVVSWILVVDQALILILIAVDVVQRGKCAMALGVKG